MTGSAFELITLITSTPGSALALPGVLAYLYSRHGVHFAVVIEIVTGDNVLDPILRIKIGEDVNSALNDDADKDEE